MIPSDKRGEETTASYTHPTRGLPSISRSILRGSRVEARRAGMIATVFMPEDSFPFRAASGKYSVGKFLKFTGGWSDGLASLMFDIIECFFLMGRVCCGRSICLIHDLWKWHRRLAFGSVYFVRWVS